MTVLIVLNLFNMWPIFNVIRYNAHYVVLQLDLATLYSSIFFSYYAAGKLWEFLSQTLCNIIGRQRRK